VLIYVMGIVLITVITVSLASSMGAAPLPA
jgi:hypothetical protein